MIPLVENYQKSAKKTSWKTLHPDLIANKDNC